VSFISSSSGKRRTDKGLVIGGHAKSIRQRIKPVKRLSPAQQMVVNDRACDLFYADRNALLAASPGSLLDLALSHWGDLSSREMARYMTKARKQLGIKP
jgi:hypothetical protein